MTDKNAAPGEIYAWRWENHRAIFAAGSEPRAGATKYTRSDILENALARVRELEEKEKFCMDVIREARITRPFLKKLREIENQMKAEEPGDED